MKLPSKLQQYVTAIVGALITIALTMFSDFVLNLPKEITWLTFFIGAIITVIITLLEQRLLDTISTELNRKLEIYRLLEQISDPEMSILADMAVNECIQRLRDYNNGFVPVSEHGYLVTWLIKCKRSLQATFWVSSIDELYKLEDESAGRNYMQSNVDAIKRGVRIQRVFIMNKEGLVDASGHLSDPKALRILATQQKAGIEVRVNWLNEWARYGNTSELYKDFVIIDETEVRANSFGVTQKLLGTTWIKNSAQVSEYKKVFEQLWRLGLPLAEISPMEIDTT